MNDRVFFPLVLLVSILLVWLSMQTFGDELPKGSISGANTDYTRITVEGPQLNRLIKQEEIETTLTTTPTGTVLTVRPVDAFFPSAADAGPHFRLAPDIEVAFSAQPLLITLRARAAPENGAPSVEMNYLAGPEGQSGWQRFELGPEFQDYSFTYKTPVASQDRGVDFLGIRPVVDGEASGIEIESLSFQNLAFQATGTSGQAAR